MRKCRVPQLRNTHNFSTIVLIDHDSRVRSSNVTKHDRGQKIKQRNVLEIERFAAKL